MITQTLQLCFGQKFGKFYCIIPIHTPGLQYIKLGFNGGYILHFLMKSAVTAILDSQIQRCRIDLVRMKSSIIRTK